MPDKPKRARVAFSVWSQDHLARLLEVPGVKLLRLEQDSYGEIALQLDAPDVSMAELGILMQAWRTS